MKISTFLTITFLLLFASLRGFGQTISKIHFFNPSGRIIIEKFPDDYLKLKGYSLIETKDDSLFFTNEKSPMSIGIEKGKNYYFLVITYARSGNDYSISGLKVEEVSEREFFLTLLMNKHGRKPDEIFSY
jgi:hypothetical protein